VQIYLDAVWLLDLLLDWMLLLLAKALSRDGTSHPRVFIGAVIASLIVPLTLFYPETFLTTVAGKILFSILIILTAFRFKSIKRSGKQLLLFYFLTFSIGGGLTGLHFMLNQPFAMHSGGIMTMNSGYGDPVSWLFILIGFPIVLFFSKRRMEDHASEKLRYDEIHPVRIQIAGQDKTVPGYIDSGNQLNCPMTKKPVVIGDASLMKTWLTSEEMLELKAASEKMDPERIPLRLQHLVQLIPYQGVDGSTSFVCALRPDFIEIMYEDKLIRADKVLIGIQFGSMTADKTYQCLLHPQLIQQSLVYSA